METSAFEVSHATNDGWGDSDGDLEMFLAIAKILTGDRKSDWAHKRGVFRNCCMKTASTFDTVCLRRILTSVFACFVAAMKV